MRVSGLISAQIIVTSDLSPCSSNCQGRKVAGHLLWAMANGLRVTAWPLWSNVLAYRPISLSAKRYLYVSGAVPRNSFEYKTLDAAVHIANSKWVLLADVETCKAFEAKQQPVSRLRTLDDIDCLILRFSQVQRERCSQGSFRG